MLHIKRTIAEEYDVISWLLRIFVGGALNIVILNTFSAFISNNVPIVEGGYQTSVLFTPILFPAFASFFALVLVAPLIISLCLTKREPYLKLVPPFYISIIGIVWISTVWLYSNLAVEIFAFFGLVLGAAGYSEDRLATSILGIATERDIIYFEHLRVYADIEAIKSRIFIPAIMSTLNLSDRVEGDAEQGYLFQMNKDYEYANLISLSRDKSYPEITDVKVVYFEKAKYNLRFSPTFIEHSKRNSGYLQSVLLEREPKLPCEVVIALTNTALDPLIDSVVDELHGYYTRYKRLPARDSVKILGLLGIAVITFGLFVSHQPDIYWQLAILFDVFVYLAELPGLFRRRK